MSYDLSTDTGKVRLLITDVDPDCEIFDDDEIEAFLLLEGNTFRAAAQALDTIATNEALVLKVIQTLDLKTDGAKLAETLMKRADRLRARADDDGEDVDDDFAVAEFADPVFGYREHLHKSILEGLR